MTGDLPYSWLVMLPLSSVVQFYIGAVFYKQAYKGLKHGSGNMGLLVALGTTAAFVYSFISLVMSSMMEPHSFMLDVYFEASALIITFVCLGKWMEAKAKVGRGAAD